MKSLEFYSAQLKQWLNQSPAFPGTDKSFPKLTIITPSYNQGKYLERTILSILNQNYPNLEYIIIDGGSQDESVDIIRKYEKYLAYWVSEKDRGQVDALNKGLARATGEWISFQNSDDVYFPDTFTIFQKAVQKHPTSDLVYGDLFMITPTDDVTEMLKTLPYSFQCQYIEGMQIHNQSLFFRKALVEKYGAFDPSYRFAFDYEFITRYTVQADIEIRRIEGLAGALRVHEEAKSSTIAKVGREEHERVKKAFRKYQTNPIPDKILYLYCRFRKIAYLLGQLDWRYIAHRRKLNSI
jgi:glycosyltransferase involved in cell wall biosynthesis